MPYPMMGGGNPANAGVMQEAGMPLSPQQQMMLQQIRAQQGVQGGAGGPGGGLPPAGPAGAAPGISPAPPAGAAPPMSQADFSGYGRPVSPDAQSAKAAQQIQLLRLLAEREQAGQ